MSSPNDLPPATAAWRAGDSVGGRRFADLGPQNLELGGALPAVRLAYQTWGRLSPARDNAVLVLHALTGDSHVTGPAGPGHRSPGWWSSLIGPDAPIDPARWFVVAANVLGGCQGSTGPSSPAPDGRPWGSRWPRITIGDQVRAEARLADLLGIDRWAAILGGSMGGMRALEWLVAEPERVGAGLVLAVGAYATADQIGTQTSQLHAIINDPGWNGGDYHHLPPGDGPHRGLGLARRIAHLTYRTADELEARFGRDPQPDENPLDAAPPAARRGAGMAPPSRYAVQSYLDHHAEKLVRRFDAGSYVALTDAMNSWDVGRGRGGVDAALTSIRTPIVVAGVDSDRLYPLSSQTQIAAAVPGTIGGLRVINSPYGHDGFLVEQDQVGPLVRETLALGQNPQLVDHGNNGHISDREWCVLP